LSIEQENIVAVYSFSRTYSSTGWRLGYLASRNQRIASMLRLADYSQTAGVVTFIQHAGKEALDNRQEGEKAKRQMVDEYHRRRDVLYDGLSAIEGVRVEKLGGAFYVCPSFAELIPSELQGTEREMFVVSQLMEHGVATVQGSCFGDHFADNIRISFSTTPVPMVKEGVERIRRAFENANK
jgi:aspartate/methionine/tyrosine aminotransferase